MPEIIPASNIQHTLDMLQNKQAELVPQVPLSKSVAAALLQENLPVSFNVNNGKIDDFKLDNTKLDEDALRKVLEIRDEHNQCAFRADVVTQPFEKENKDWKGATKTLQTLRGEIKTLQQEMVTNRTKLDEAYGKSDYKTIGELGSALSAAQEKIGVLEARATEAGAVIEAIAGTPASKEAPTVTAKPSLEASQPEKTDTIGANELTSLKDEMKVQATELLGDITKDGHGYHQLKTHFPQLFDADGKFDAGRFNPDEYIMLPEDGLEELNNTALSVVGKGLSDVPQKAQETVRKFQEISSKEQIDLVKNTKVFRDFLYDLYNTTIEPYYPIRMVSSKNSFLGAMRGFTTLGLGGNVTTLIHNTNANRFLCAMWSYEYANKALSSDPGRAKSYAQAAQFWKNVGNTIQVI